jgi:ribose transport system substrate-binding protein
MRSNPWRRRVRSGVPLTALLLAAALTLIACGDDDDDAPTNSGTASSQTAKPDGRLLWIQPLRDHPVHRLMQAGFKQRCEEKGYDCEIVGNPSATNFDVPATTALADAAISKGDVAGAGVYAVDPALYPYVGKLARDGMPVVSWHQKLPEGEVEGLKAIAGTDPEVYAIAAAEEMATAIDCKGTVAITQGSINNTENQVTAKFTETLERECPNVKALKPQIEGFEPSAARAKAAAIIQGNAGVTGAFSSTGGGPQTWAGAAKQTGKDIKIISMDYVRANLDLVKSGEVHAIVAQPLYEEGAKVADYLATLSTGGKVPYFDNIPAPIVTRENVDKYYAILEKAGQ